jgi:DNA-directed RNA polymerase specialized sigma24 family protein
VSENMVGKTRALAVSVPRRGGTGQSGAAEHASLLKIPFAKHLPLCEPESGFLEWKSRLDSELGRVIRQAVSSLPYEQPVALVLFRFEDLSYEEIIEIMGKSVSAVTSLLWRARTAAWRPQGVGGRYYGRAARN